jgi:hypothetical protein
MARPTLRARLSPNDATVLVVKTRASGEDAASAGIAHMRSMGAGESGDVCACVSAMNGNALPSP